MVTSTLPVLERSIVERPQCYERARVGLHHVDVFGTALQGQIEALASGGFKYDAHEAGAQPLDQLPVSVLSNVRCAILPWALRRTTTTFIWEMSEPA